eukprot:TRINITY_DN1964_c0_g1_i5.p1 TRINITY_DN1964_c0_g1~~TRINITY_DN1964_c0_g1_i5.p1  ORF type:complete len:233 (+),score=9.16 TRINITY_DN1964_c0_g1_i5:234-932(+)
MARNLGRYGVLFSAIIVVHLLWGAFHVHQTGWIGYLRTLIINICLHVLDYLTSTATSENLDTMERSGIPRYWALVIAAFNLATGTLLPAIVTIYFVGPVEYRFDLSLVLTVLFSLAIADITFYCFHMYLHRNLPHLHLMHHCCKRTSYTTNAFFHPLDLIMEFSGPALSLIILVRYVFRDPFALLVGLAVLPTWYVRKEEWSRRKMSSPQLPYTRDRPCCYCDILLGKLWDT